ncbi:MAG: biopolymer transporter ExbD [Simkaniaceae bacterium]|nr:biopolymer transporter ExbD [Simkaniaceae bacterium]
MRRRRFSKGTDEEREDEAIDLTPLIDVVFVVLITFILIAPLLKLDHISLAPVGVKEKASVTPQNKSGIVLRVAKNETITLNEKPITIKELAGSLAELGRNQPGEIPKLFQDEKSSFGMYQTIKNALEEAGFEEMDVILKP